MDGRSGSMSPSRRPGPIQTDWDTGWPECTRDDNDERLFPNLSGFLVSSPSLHLVSPAPQGKMVL